MTPINPDDFGIKTYKGHSVNLKTGPTADQVDIEDIAHSLAYQVRFCGHVNRFYSIAEHSIYMAKLANKMHAVYYLLHDSHETWYHDVSSPLKRLLRSKSTEDYYKQLCDQCDQTVIQALGLNVVGFNNLKKDIKEADNMMLKLEQQYLFGRISSPVFPEDHPLHGAPFGIDPDEAEMEFLKLYRTLTT